MVKRGKLQIMRDILKLILEHKGRIKPTPLLRKSKMSSSRFKEYYTELIRKDLIKEVYDENMIKKITISDKGLKFLERYMTILDFIDEFEL